MKRIVKPAIILAIVAFGGSAFAAQSFTSAGSVIGGGTFKTSTNVIISAASDGTNYAATSAHISGGKQYGTLSNDPKIYVNETNKPTTSGPSAVTSATALPNATNFK